MRKQAEIKNPQPTVMPRLLTVAQAAEYLNISARSLYNRTGPRAKNPFPVRPKRIGRSLRFDKQELDRFIASL